MIPTKRDIIAIVSMGIWLGAALLALPTGTLAGPVPPPIDSSLEGAPPTPSGGAGITPVTNGTPTPATTPSTPATATAGTTSGTPGPTCKENSGSTTALDCDMTYRDTPLYSEVLNNGAANYTAKNKAGQNVLLPTMFAPYPKDRMPMKNTPRLSFIKDFSPLLYDSMQNKDGTPYAGFLARGTLGDATQTFAAIGATPDGVTRQNGCVNQINLTGITSPADQAKLIRLQLDNCANQFILNSAIWPFYKSNSNFICATKDEPFKRCTQEDICQPLRMTTDPNQEYLPSTYIKAAWEKLLNDPTKLLRDGKAPKEPHLPATLKFDKTLPPPTIPEVRINELAATPYEEIIDPSHPFSPRWDYEYNERDKYSPMTQSYSKDPKNAVFCAGSKDKVYKVDILTFREDKLKFDKKITDRINYNNNCMANSGIQKNPCCYFDVAEYMLQAAAAAATFQPPPKPKCKPLTCGQCFEMTANKPACSTNYSYTPDRASTIKLYEKNPLKPVFPVAAELRIGATVAQLQQALSLSNFPPGTTVAQAASIVQAQASTIASVASSIPGANMSQVMPMLNGQLSMIANIRNINIGGINISNLNLNISSFGSLMSAPGQMLKGLGDAFNPANLQGMLRGQVNLIGNLPGGANLAQAMSTLGAIQNTVSTFSQFSGAGGMDKLASSLRTQVNISSSFPGGSTVADAINIYNKYGPALANLPSDMPATDALKKVGVTSSDLRIFAKIPTGTKNGDLTIAINSQGKGLSGLDPKTLMSAATDIFSSQADAMLGLPPGISVKDAGSMVTSLKDTLGGLASGNAKIDIHVATSFLNSQMDAMVHLPLGIKPSQLATMITSTQGLMGSIKDMASLNNIQGMFTARLSAMGPLGNISASVVGNMMSGQALGLSSISGVSALSSVSSLVDGTALGGAISGAKNLSSLTSMPQFSGLDKVGMKGLTKSLGSVDPTSCLSSAGGSGPYSLPCVLMFLPLSHSVAQCFPGEIGPANDTKMEVLCKALRAPYTSLNKLKMRYHNPDDPSTQVMTNGVQDGLNFKDYFDDDQTHVAHMPYPRLWDTGRSIQTSNSTDQDPMDTAGQYTAVVGVGREGSLDGKHKDERCNYGGWGGDVSFGGLSFAENDPITSWTELKLYQAYTTREQNVVCLGRYEKAFKWRSAENQLLMAAGATFTGVVKTECDLDSQGKTIPSTCKYTDMGDTTATSATPGGTVTGKKWTNLQYKQSAYPLTWLGYESDMDASKRFPFLPGNSPVMSTGLDNALCGDIILMPNGSGVEGDTASRGLPKLALVKCPIGTHPHTSGVNVDTKEGGALHFIDVLEADNGKWPDACGTTNMMGDLKTRRIFKPGEYPKNDKDELDRIGWKPSCADTMLQECEMQPWDSLKVYHAADPGNLFDGNDRTPGTPPPEDSATPGAAGGVAGAITGALGGATSGAAASATSSLGSAISSAVSGAASSLTGTIKSVTDKAKSTVDTITKSAGSRGSGSSAGSSGAAGAPPTGGTP